mgnify:FL=1
MKSIEFEAYQISVYCDTVYMLVKQHKDISVAKLIFFTYAINKERFFDKDVYNAKNTQNILNKEISTINGDFVGYANATPYILKAIHILAKADKIRIEDNIVHIFDTKFSYAKCNSESTFVYNVIEESKTWTDKRFMREVLHNV